MAGGSTQALYRVPREVLRAGQCDLLCKARVIHKIALRDPSGLTLWYSIWHVRLHVQRTQGLRYKFNNRWLTKNSRAFFLGSQTADNVFYAIVSGGGIWSAYEVFTLWAYANDLLPFMAFRTNPVGFVLLFLALPFFRAAHFYLGHRLMHWKPLYKAAHYVHHHNVNVGRGRASRCIPSKA